MAPPNPAEATAVPTTPKLRERSALRSAVVLAAPAASHPTPVGPDWGTARESCPVAPRRTWLQGPPGAFSHELVERRERTGDGGLRTSGHGAYLFPSGSVSSSLTGTPPDPSLTRPRAQLLLTSPAVPLLPFSSCRSSIAFAPAARPPPRSTSSRSPSRRGRPSTPRMSSTSPCSWSSFCPRRAGELDLPAWLIGREWCHAGLPRCFGCPLTNVCPKDIERAARVTSG